MSTELVRLPSVAASKRTTGSKDRKGQPSEDVLGPLWSKPLSAKPEGRHRVPPIRHLSRDWRVAPRPGDVFRPGPRDWNKPRPLGLLPERERYFDPFFFYEPLPPVDVGSHMLAPLLKQTQDTANDEQASVLSRSNWSASRPLSRTVAEGEHSPPSFDGAGAVPYRSSSEWRHTPSQEAAQPSEEWKEKDYFETLVRIAEMDMLSRSRGQEVAPRPGRGRGVRNLQHPRGRGVHWEEEDIRPPLNTPDVSVMKQTQNSSRARSLSGPASYFSFVNQAALSTRVYDLDQRWAKDHEPCERCRLRGGRCSRCKAIRTGGGYIILDLGEEDGRLKQRDDGDVCECGDDGMRQNTPEEGDRAGTSLGVIREGDENGFGDGKKWDGDDSLLENSRRGLSGKGHGQGGGAFDIGGGGGLGDGIDSGRRSRTGGESGRRSASGRVRSGRLGSGRGSRLSSAMSGRGTDDSDDESARKQSGLNLSSDSENLNSGRDGLSGRGNEGDGGAGGGTRNKSGRGERQKGSVDRRPRESRDGNLAKLNRKGKRTTGEGESDGEGDDMSGKGKNLRGRRKKGPGEEGDGDDDDEGHDDGRGKDRRQLRGSGLEQEEEETKPKVAGDLRKFRSKRNDVKALSCTLKDLKDIDPLDYLAKYCILDPKKIPNYRRVYDNVDRDEDDEINIQELDFALKAVNFELISDPELSYIHSVLELAGRWRLNFRLFSLIAALSEKVVALEHMVKKLINTMDVQALEVKMKKCKELFYLLDSMDSTGRGGVVTTQSLAVELQAGGLTQEHVEYVTDHLNHEGRGIVEFLDYLTYVPLFVEIHDSICGNPLDVSRTK